LLFASLLFAQVRSELERGMLETANRRPVAAAGGHGGRSWRMLVVDRRRQGQLVVEPSRRVLLAVVAAGGAGLAGCKGIAALGPVPGLPADVVTLNRAIAAEELMVASYAAAVAKLGAVTTAGGNSAFLQVVTAIHAQHQAHLGQLRRRLVLPPRSAASKLGHGRQLAAAMPDSQAGVLGVLTAAEHAAAARLTTELLSVPAALAQLMASIAASEAAHVVVLRRAGRA